MKNMSVPIQFYATEKDYSLLCELAEQTKLSKSKILRYLIRGCNLVQAPPADYPKLIRELRATGNNLNQLVKLARTTGYINTPELTKILDDLRKTEHEVNLAFTVKQVE